MIQGNLRPVSALDLRVYEALNILVKIHWQAPDGRIDGGFKSRRY